MLYSERERERERERQRESFFFFFFFPHAHAALPRTRARGKAAENLATADTLLVLSVLADNYRELAKQISAGDGPVFCRQLFPLFLSRLPRAARDTWRVIRELCPIYILIDSTTGIVIFQFADMVRDGGIACRSLVAAQTSALGGSMGPTISHAIMTSQLFDADKRLVFRTIRDAD